MKEAFFVITQVLSNDSICILERQRALGSNTTVLEHLLIAFKLSVALGMERRCKYVSHTDEPDERFNVVCHELRTVVAVDPGASRWICCKAFWTIASISSSLISGRMPQ